MTHNPLRAFLALLALVFGAPRVAPRQVIGFRPARRHEAPGLYPIFSIAGADENGDAILEALRGKSLADISDDKLPDELRGKTPDELQRFINALDVALRSIHQDKGRIRFAFAVGVRQYWADSRRLPYRRCRGRSFLVVRTWSASEQTSDAGSSTE